ncbi:MAG: NCS2 family permease [Acidobacteria bacterium]|nr:NCS2 family permease [Acidobacteriota bacterium]
MVVESNRASVWGRWFHLSENGTTIRTELLAGVTTFLTMAYIIFVQPAVLSAAGMDFGAVLVATCLSSALATLLMAFLANYPIAVAPAMGHNFFFAFSVVLGMKVPWPVALGGVAIAGMSFILTAGFGLRERLITAIPESLKHAIAVGIGLLIATIGLQWAGVIVASPGTLVTLGNLQTPPVLLSLFGLAFMAVLFALNIRGAVLWGILVATAAGLVFGLVRYQGLVSRPPSLAPTLLQLDILRAFKPEMIEVIFVFFFLALFDSVGTLVGVAQQAGLMKNGVLPRARQALLADAIGTVGGAALGTSTVTAYIESATGVSAGGRTGLANMMTAALFLLSLLFFPLVKMIGGGYQIAEGHTLYPVIAPALILVGTMMMQGVRLIPWDDMTEAIPAFLTLIMMPLAVSITEGIAFGFISYAVLKLAVGRGRQVHWFMYLFAALFLIRYIVLV